DVPGRIVPDQKQGRLALGGEFLTAPIQERDGQVAERTSVDETEPDLVRGVRGADEQTVGGQRFGVGIVLGDGLFDQTQGLLVGRPSRHLRMSRATPPSLIFEAQRPTRMRLQQTDQTVARPFFRAYAGSGEVIHSLARFQRTPKRTKVTRTV